MLLLAGSRGAFLTGGTGATIRYLNPLGGKMNHYGEMGAAIEKGVCVRRGSFL